MLTSATLTVAGSFAYFRDMTGLTGDLDVREACSPRRSTTAARRCSCSSTTPAAPGGPTTLAARQGERLKRIADVTGGRMLALFTNKRDMHRVAAVVGEHVEDDGVLVLAQGLHGSAAALAEEFRTHPETVLLGVDTLWTGQDFPGDALVCLVIAKLPFPRQDPLFRARRRACEEAGERWFDRFYLPEAVLKFRQGFGRLIRTETDAGVIVVLDHRLTQKTYRKRLPREPARDGGRGGRACRAGRSGGVPPAPARRGGPGARLSATSGPQGGPATSVSCRCPWPRALPRA